MLAGILFLVLVVAVAVLITVDVVRTPNEAAIGPPDQHAQDGERARGGAGATRSPANLSRGSNLFRPRSRGSGLVRPRRTPSSGPIRRRASSTSRAGTCRCPRPAHGAPRGKSDAMFVNLSRRSQALVERQLRLIESLEHGEQDQQRLASLSRLNRIAMRMHRNSQNLLVLAGQEPATSWSQPVTLARLVEAALAEVEDYQRVSFEVQPDIAVRGPAVHDAVHLLVELIDNATSFSAADMPVQVRGQVLTTGGALVDITDRGIGMAANEMAYANQQLDNPPPPDIDVPKWMGLLVVARLAARHGIRVRLNQADLGGLTALVWLPDEILTHYSAAADPGHPAAPRAATASAPAFVPRGWTSPWPSPIRPGRLAARRPRSKPSRPPRGSPAPAAPRAGRGPWRGRAARRTARRPCAGCPSSTRSSHAGPRAPARHPVRSAWPRPARPPAGPPAPAGFPGGRRRDSGLSHRSRSAPWRTGPAGCPGPRRVDRIPARRRPGPDRAPRRGESWRIRRVLNRSRSRPTRRRDARRPVRLQPGRIPQPRHRRWHAGVPWRSAGPDPSGRRHPARRLLPAVAHARRAGRDTLGRARAFPLRPAGRRRTRPR